MRARALGSWFVGCVLALGSLGCGEGPGCRSEASQFCFEGVLYWQDSCGRLGAVKESCTLGCAPDGLGCATCARATCESLGRECGAGDDGCGGTLECGSCGAEAGCSPEGRCGCRYESCEGLCCPLGLQCTPVGCCRPSCGSRECGPDSCGGLCGECGTGASCGPDGQCACDILACGDACCAAGEVCAAGACCLPTCSGRVCGGDGCGGSCGGCDAGLVCKADGQCAAASWEGVELGALSAPDEYRLVVELVGDPGPAAAEAPGLYRLSSLQGELAVQSVRYQAAGPRLVLTTARQKLGVSYTLHVDDGAGSPGLQGEFLSADTARLWVVDWSDPNFGQVQVTARRLGVGVHCVLYAEEGQAADDTAHTLQAFDERVFPVLTERLIAAPDLDGNDRILLLGLDGGDDYGGYFSSVNAYPDADTMAWWGLHSNEMEIVHCNLSYGAFDVQNVVTHEFGHLLYHERHGLTADYWEYHDEGLAECAVHSAWGVNQYAIDYFLWDPNGTIGRGLSLVDWEWGLYDNYVVAYLFWTYVAGRLGGVPAYREIFDLEDGDPDEVDGFLRQNLGQGFPEVRRDQFVANWVAAETGIYGYDGILPSLPAHQAPGAPAGATSLQLVPFAGSYFHPAAAQVDYPGTQGSNIAYVGVNDESVVDLEAPFEVGGGALVVVNMSMEHAGFPAEPSGPFLDPLPWAVPPQPPRGELPVSPAWRDPPPFRPDRLLELARWREARRAASW